MYNKIILAGNLTRDVEVRYTQGGSAIGNTAIATSRKFKSATGEQKEEVLFVDLTFFGRTAEIANQYLRKGSKVLVDGRLKLDQWTAQDGSKRSKHSVTVENLQMLGSKGENEAGMGGGGYNSAPAQDTYSQPAPSQPAPQAAPQQAAPTTIPEIDINEDEIPF
jgi:single-strand DNA-binding protein